MRKLKDDKKIKWKEVYTEQSEFLKEQYEHVVGPDSYQRFEGVEVDGPGEWYVVVGPAGVREEHKAKFFAGIRKLPNKYPASGKNFDSLVDALNYARDTWGTPRSKNVPHYTVSDLTGITSRINDYKKDKEERDAKVEKVEKEAGYPVYDLSLIKTAMAKKIVHKVGVYFDLDSLNQFLSERFLNGDGNIDKQVVFSETQGYQFWTNFYNFIVDMSSYSSPDEVVDYIRQNNSRKVSVSVNVEEFIDRRSGTNKREISIEGRNTSVVQFLKAKYGDVTASTGSDFDLMALIATASKMDRHDFNQILDSVGHGMGDEFASQLSLPSPFEEGLVEGWVNHREEISRIKENYDFASATSQLEEYEGLNTDITLPCKDFLEYSLRDSSTRIAMSRPYRHQRSFGERYTFADDTLRKVSAIGDIDVDVIDLAIFNSSNPDGQKVFGEREQHESEIVKAHLNSGSCKIKAQTIVIKNHPFTKKQIPFLQEDIMGLLSGQNSDHAPGKSEAIIGAIRGHAVTAGYVNGEAEIIRNTKEDGTVGYLMESKGGFYFGTHAQTDLFSKSTVKKLAEKNNYNSSIMRAGNDYVDKRSLSESIDNYMSHFVEEDKQRRLTNIRLAVENTNEDALSSEGFLEVCESIGLNSSEALVVFNNAKSKAVFYSVELVKDLLSSFVGNESIEMVNERIDVYTAGDLTINQVGLSRILDQTGSHVDKSNFFKTMKAQREKNDVHYFDSLEPGDIKVGLSETTSGSVSRLKIEASDYFYHKSFRNLIGNSWGLKRTHPETYLRVLRSTLVPQEIIHRFDLINNSGNTDLGEKVSQSEDLLNDYFSDEENRSNLDLKNCFRGSVFEGESSSRSVRNFKNAFDATQYKIISTVVKDFYEEVNTLGFDPDSSEYSLLSDSLYSIYGENIKAPGSLPSRENTNYARAAIKVINSAFKNSGKVSPFTNLKFTVQDQAISPSAQWQSDIDPDYDSDNVANDSNFKGHGSLIGREIMSGASFSDFFKSVAGGKARGISYGLPTDWLDSPRDRYDLIDNHLIAQSLYANNNNSQVNPDFKNFYERVSRIRELVKSHVNGVLERSLAGDPVTNDLMIANKYWFEYAPPENASVNDLNRWSRVKSVKYIDTLNKLFGGEVSEEEMSGYLAEVERETLAVSNEVEEDAAEAEVDENFPVVDESPEVSSDLDLDPDEDLDFDFSFGDTPEIPEPAKPKAKPAPSFSDDEVVEDEDDDEIWSFNNTSEINNLITLSRYYCNSGKISSAKTINLLISEKLKKLKNPSKKKDFNDWFK